MFEFFKKKEKQVDLAVEKPQTDNYTPFAGNAKAADSAATFEIPDFTEEDLNFDLGLGEFMSGKDQSIVNASASSQAAPSPVPQPPSPAAQAAQPTQEDQIKQIQSQSNEPSTVLLDQEAPDEDLPRFQVFPSLDSSVEFGEPAKPYRRKSVYAEDLKQAAPIQEVKQAQTTVEGRFITKEDYVKTILLADDVTTKSAVAQTQISSIMTTSEAQSAEIEDLKTTARAVGSALMIADSKLFGDGGGK